MNPTPIQHPGTVLGNELFIKREDLIPFSFGGNKARKAVLFFREIDAGGYDCVLTYGSSSSNHCRVVANLCAARKISCFIVSPAEASKETYNSILIREFGAKTVTVPVRDVHDTIEKLLLRLKDEGKHPFFIPGGGHGNTGTEAYAECYREILAYESQNHTFFDYLFLASGTGTTQAGLIAGQIRNRDRDRQIIGISIARPCPRGREVVMQSIRDYLGSEADEKEIGERTVFLDDYVGAGYGATDNEIRETIRRVMADFGIPLDETYTGKAFYGMEQYLKQEHITKKNILFLHTGGTPLFFDYLSKQRKAIV